MSGHTDLLGYFFQAALVVKLVMILLFAASIVSWTLIFQRAWYFKQQNAACALFSERFWQSTDLNMLFTQIDRNRDEQEGLAGIFHAAFKEYLRCRQQGGLVLERIARVMHIGQNKEALHLEKHLPLFASIGSVTPYVGLFGTVWGIMMSLQALGQAQQATIAMVAPGISEALVATALGLFTAIPAVLAYNRYSTQAGLLLERYQLFQDELLALMEQQTPAQARE